MMTWKNLKIGNFVQGKVTFVKEYGLILKIKNFDGVTGFILNENLIN
jgi:ribosomal protein S1